ncbi:hypothetical protein [Burkholderia sp. SRS-W-2-2016]|uniref:hypothetical protein n=1 Tax=Burkholderia sp. SRS-W-2-2016 TaxID=1926878 RepID=UPI000AB470C7|nr:hypothetical protein [Burkholderia sp. SRS-W-2-2016]
MSFPEWGCSYNALHVPLTSDWQCSLVPACEVEDVDRGWQLSYEERQRVRKEREEQIEQDRQDFDRLFRVSTCRHAARSCSDFATYAAFISEHLRISGLSAPVDGDGVTRILRDAVRDGRLVPAINRAWRGSRRVARPYGPQSWPKRAPDPQPTVYALRDGQFIPLDANGRMIDRTPYVPSNGGFDWLGAVGAMSGVALGSAGPGFNGSDGANATLLGDAQPFEYGSSAEIGATTEIAARGVRMTGNKPGGYRLNPNGQDVDYFDSHGNICAQFHASHGDPHGHNFDCGIRDDTHLPMSPINFD